MRIGIYGGNFNPIHHGHLIVASYVYEEMNLDKLVFVPAGNHPFKKSQSSFEDRFNMVKLAIEGDRRFELSRIEDKEEPAYTYSTIMEIKAQSDDRFFFIMGADSLEGLDKWYRYEDLLNEIEIVVVNRSGSRDLNSLIKLYQEGAKGIYKLDGPIIELSSSLIRRRLADKKPIRYLTTERVREYINEHGLYSQD